MYDIIVFSEDNEIKTIKGIIISEDEFFVKIKDDYNNEFSIAKSTITKIKKTGGSVDE